VPGQSVSGESSARDSPGVGEFFGVLGGLCELCVIILKISSDSTVYSAGQARQAAPAGLLPRGSFPKGTPTKEKACFSFLIGARAKRFGEVLCERLPRG